MPSYTFQVGGEAHDLDVVLVEGTRGHPYLFGEGHETLHVEVSDFYIARFPVTQALWTHIMGENPAIVRGHRRPVENVSWAQITSPESF